MVRCEPGLEHWSSSLFFIFSQNFNAINRIIFWILLKWLSIPVPVEPQLELIDISYGLIFRLSISQAQWCWYFDNLYNHRADSKHTFEIQIDMWEKRIMYNFFHPPRESHTRTHTHSHWLILIYTLIALNCCRTHAHRHMQHAHVTISLCTHIHTAVWQWHGWLYRRNIDKMEKKCRKKEQFSWKKATTNERAKCERKNPGGCCCCWCSQKW